MTTNSNRKNVLFVFGALAIVLVAVFVIWRPPALHNEDASGAIAPVQKHHEAQITPQDVVLGDEAAKQEQNVVYGDMLNDSAKLQSISAEFGAMAASRVDNNRVTAASKNLASHQADLQARYAKYAGSFVTAASRIAARAEDRKLESDVAELGSRLNSKLASSDMDALNAKMASISAVCSKLSSITVAQSKFAGAMDALQARSPEAASRLNSAADALESRNADASLGSIHSALDAITMQSKSIDAAQSRLAAMVESKQADNRAYQSISADFAQSSIQLESRGLNNLASRLNDEAEMGSRLASMTAELGAKAQSINMASAMASKSSDNISAAASRLNAALASRQAEYAQRAAASINFAQRDLASRQFGNREAASRALAAAHQLGARPEVAARMDSRLASRAN
jgi:hypothetical protein